MKQIIVIHGANSYANYDEYLRSLSSKPVTIENFIRGNGWKERLQQNLGSGYQVLQPAMPNKKNARYVEWKIWFDNLATIASDDCVLIGHSMGGIFLTKYLSENTFPHIIKATILVAAPYNNEDTYDLNDFKLQTVSNLFSSQAGRTVFYFGTDDPVVPIAEMDKYRHDLPSAEFNIVPAPDHFSRTEFPEIVDLIKQI